MIYYSQLKIRNAQFLVLFDLSAAFDIVDHPRQIKRLETQYGITDASLTWIKSYLSGKKQCVIIHGVLSHKNELDQNIPQGCIWIIGAYFYSGLAVPVEDVLDPEVNNYLFVNEVLVFRSQEQLLGIYHIYTIH